MRTDIRHSGGVNYEPRFTLHLVEMAHTSITVNVDKSALSVEINEAELRDMLVRGIVALETAKINKRFWGQEMTREEYDAAISALDKWAPVLPESVE